MATTGGSVQLIQSVGVLVSAPTAKVHIVAGTAVAATAPLKLDPGVVLAVTESGAVESDGTNIYWTDALGTRWTLNNSAAETLAQAYAAGAAAFDQTLILLNAKGGALVINATTPGPLFTGVTALEINVIGGSVNFYTKGGFDVSSSISAAAGAATWNEVDFATSTLTLTGGPAASAALAMVHVGSAVINGPGNTVTDAYNLRIDAGPAGTATITRSWSLGVTGAVQLLAGLVLGPTLAPPGESGIVFAAGATNISVANTGRLGYLAGVAQQFMVSVNTSVYVPVLMGPAAAGFTPGSVPFGAVSGQLAQDNTKLFWDTANKRLGVGVAVPTANLHLAATTAVADTASLKLDAGALLAVVEPGAVESDGTNLWWTDGGGVRRQLDNATPAAAQTLATTYGFGAGAADQTMTLVDPKGGITIDGSGGGFTATSALVVNAAAAGSVAFPRIGGLSVTSTISVAAAPGATWDADNFAASTLTLTGGPATATAVAMMHVGTATINGAGNTVTDAYNFHVDVAPGGAATLTRSWSAGFDGAVQAKLGLVLGAGLAPPAEPDLVVGAGAVNVSVANSGRLGYLAGATQQFMVSMNGAAYVPLLYGPGAAGFTLGSVPFGSATGTLAEDNANFFWDNTGKRLGIDVAAAPTAKLHLPAGTATASTAPLKIATGGVVLTVPEPGAVETDANHVYWTNAAGTRLQLDNSTVTTTLAQAYANGSVSADQTLALLDTEGGKFIVDGTAVGFTGTAALSVLSTNVATSLAQSAVVVTTTFAPTSGTATFTPVRLAYTINQTGGANGAITGIFVNATETALVGTHALLDMQVATVSKFRVDNCGCTTITQTALNAALRTALTVTGGAHTAITASTEDIGANFNFSATKQWATGALVTQREIVIQAPTYAFVGGSTITSAATLAITNAPIQGTNATLTNAYAFWTQAGATQLDGGSYVPTAGTKNHLGITMTFAPTSGTASFNAVSLVYTVNQTGGANGTVNGIFVNATETAVVGTHNLLDLQVASADRFTVNRRGGLTITQGAVAGTTTFATALIATGAAHTTLTASTEVFGANFNFSATKQWATGALATQREIVFQAPTYAFVGGSTITTAATVAITGSPILGANAAITNPLALWVQSGVAAFAGTVGVGTTNPTTLEADSLFTVQGASATAVQTALINTSTGETSLIIRRTGGTASRWRIGSLAAEGHLRFMGNMGAQFTLFDPTIGGGAASIGQLVSGGSPLPVFWAIPAAHTNSTAGTELPNVQIDAATKQWATGAIATQRDFLISAPTYAFVGASTITNAATLAITNAPIPGTNATLTNAYALWTQAGAVQHDGGSYANTASTKNHLGITTTFAPTSGTAAFNAVSLTYTVNQTGGANGTVNGILVNATETAVVGTHNLLGLQIGAADRFVVNRRGGLTITQGIVAGSTTFATAMAVTGAAHTTLTASTEVFGINFNQSATKQWSTGAIATQREVIFQAPTYAFVGGSTVTTAATVAITGAPIAGANATLTTSLALWVQASSSRFDPIRTVATAAGAAWDGLSVGASTLTLTGAGTITALSLFNVLGPTITSTSAAVTTDFYTTRIGIATFTGAGPASATRSWSLYAEGNVRLGAGQTIKGTDVNVAGPYTVLATDYVLEVRRTATAAITITLPALTGGIQLNGRLICIKDSGYNAAVNNITAALGNAADKIENVNANRVINTNGAVLWLKANTTTTNWEIV